MKDCVVLGTLGSPHGVKGWMKVNSYTEKPESIFQYSKWYLGQARLRHVRFPQADGKSHLYAENLIEIQPAEWRRQGTKWIVKISGIESPEEVKAYSGREICVPESELPELGGEDFYWKDLEGATVVNADGKPFGKVAYLIETGSNDVLVVKPTQDSIDDNERLIPYIFGQVVTEVQTSQQSQDQDSQQPTSRGVTLIRVNWDEAY